MSLAHPLFTANASKQERTWLTVVLVLGVVLFVLCSPHTQKFMLATDRVDDNNNNNNLNSKSIEGLRDKRDTNGDRPEQLHQQQAEQHTQRETPFFLKTILYESIPHTHTHTHTLHTHIIKHLKRKQFVHFVFDRNSPVHAHNGNLIFIYINIYIYH